MINVTHFITMQRYGISASIISRLAVNVVFVRSPLNSFDIKNASSAFGSGAAILESASKDPMHSHE